MRLKSMDRKALIREIADELLRGNNVALLAPMGWGKTWTAFNVATELAQRGYKVAYLAPTLTLALKKWHEILQIVSASKQSAILTAGAQQFCTYRWRYPQRYCNRCALRRNVRIEAPPVVMYQELDMLTPEDACGYHVQELIFPSYNIIVGHYGRARKILPYVNVVILEEAHEQFIPMIESLPLVEISEMLEVDVSELRDVSAIKEIAETRLIEADPKREDAIYHILQMLRKTCWIEDQMLNCMDLRSWPSGVPMLALTATPPPGWPPEGWGKKIEIKPTIKAKAFIETTAKFYYKDKYEGAALLLHLVTNWLRRTFNVDDIAVFATSSLREKLQYSLPPGVQLFPAGG
jgi:hypothetical protein